MRWFYRGPARTLNRLGKHQRGVDRSTSPALANPAKALLLSPVSGCESLALAIIRWSRMFRWRNCHFGRRRDALAFLWPIRDAFRAEEIDAPTVKHLTLATKAQQKAWQVRGEFQFAEE